MWVKKQYKITLQLTPKDLDTLLDAVTFVNQWADGKRVEKRALKNLYFKIHNKCVKLNQ